MEQRSLDDASALRGGWMGWNTLLQIVLLNVAIPLCLLVAAFLAAQPRTGGAPGVVIRKAELASLGGPRSVALPNILAASDFRPEGGRVRYRLVVNLPDRPDQPFGIFVSKLSLSGRFYLNGGLIGSCGAGRLEDLRCLHQSQLFVAPAMAWRKGLNTLEFEVYATSRQVNGLTEVRVGDAEALQKHFAWHNWFHYDLLSGLAWISGAIGLLSFGVGLILLRGNVYLWFGLTSIANAVASLNEFVTTPPLPIDLYNWLVFCSRLVSVPMLFLTVLAVFEKSDARITRASLAFVVLAPLALWLSDSSRQLVGWLYVPWLLAVPLVIVMGLRWSFRSRHPLHWQMTGLQTALFVGGAIDWLKTLGVANFQTGHLLPYLYGGTLVILGLALTLGTSVLRTIALEKQVAERMAYEVTQNIPIGTFSLVLPLGATKAHYSFASQRYLELTGLPLDLNGQDMALGFDIVHPEDRSRWAGLHSDAIAGKQPISGRARIDVHGEQRRVAVEARPRQLADGTTIWEGVLIDETEQVLAIEAAERDRAALQANLIRESRLQEREELLRDMHDGFGSQLANARMMADCGVISPQQVSDLLSEFSAELYLMVDTLRHADLTLEDALADMRYRQTGRLAQSGKALQWRIDLAGMPELKPRAVLQVLRILQEALNNALKHSGAQTIVIALSFDKDGNRLDVSVRDDGKGLPDGSHPGRGLHNMRHRAREIGGALQIVGSDSGTEVALELPLDSPTLAAC